MVEQFYKFGDVEIEKKEFHSSEKAVDVNKAYIKKILLSNEFAHGKNKETDANNSYDIKLVKKDRPLLITLSQKSGISIKLKNPGN